MSDEQITEQSEAPEQPPAGEPEPTSFDAEYVKKLRAESAKYRTEAKANAEAAKRLAELEESQKSEQQKLLERAEAAERERDAVRTEALRLRIAHEKGLTPKQAARLRGSTEEELLADADDLLSEFQPSTARRFGDVDQGVRGSTTKGGADLTDPAKLADAVVAQRGY